MPEKSFKEERIRKILQLYYSKLEVQKAIYEFSKDREISPRYFEGFGKRPDTFQYPGDVFEMVKKGATSFHCSEEIWEDPLEIATGMTEEKLNELRTGWDLLIDIDSKYIDYSKVMAEIIVSFLKFNGIKNMGIKFSGSKGFHILVPFKAFPKEINGIKTSDMFPQWPRIIMSYIIEKTKPQLINKISDLTKPNKYIKDFSAPKEVMPDLILVSPRHLFRCPYSLHEKTALASVVLKAEELSNFEFKHADPMQVKIHNFMPDSEEGEAKELLMQALDWYREHHKEEKKEINKETSRSFKPIKLEKISDDFLSPSIRKILEGVGDGRKRALFILLNLFRSIGMEKDELEKRIGDWNNKNQVPLKQGYIKSQLEWSYRNKIVPPPNFDKDHYSAIGIKPTVEEMRFKNPVAYTVKKALGNNKK